MSTIVGKLVIHFETNKSNDESPDGVYLAIGLIIVLLSRTFFYNNYGLIISHLAMKSRVATCHIIYNKVCSSYNHFLNISVIETYEYILKLQTYANNTQLKFRRYDSKKIVLTSL